MCILISPSRPALLPFSPKLFTHIPLQIQTVEVRLTLTLGTALTSCVHSMVIPGAPNLYESAMHRTCRHYARVCRHENPPHSEAIMKFDIRAISRIKFTSKWPRHGVVARPPAFCSRRVYDVTYVITQLCNNCITTVYQPHTIRRCICDARVSSCNQSGLATLQWRGQVVSRNVICARHTAGASRFRIRHVQEIFKRPSINRTNHRRTLRQSGLATLRWRGQVGFWNVFSTRVARRHWVARPFSTARPPLALTTHRWRGHARILREHEGAPE